MTIDIVDLRILDTVSETTTYKKAVFEQLDADISVQSVGRRIERLCEQDLLKRRFLEGSGSANVGFTTSEKGDAVLAEAEVCTGCSELRRNIGHEHSFKLFDDLEQDTSFPH